MIGVFGYSRTFLEEDAEVGKKSTLWQMEPLTALVIEAFLQVQLKHNVFTPIFK